MLKQSMYVFKKEVTDLFRDRKTWFTTILLPVLLYPALMLLISFIFSSAEEEAQGYIPVSVEDESGLIREVLAAHEAVDILSPEEIEQRMMDRLGGDRIGFMEQAIAEGVIRFHIEVEPELEARLAAMESGEVTLYFDGANQHSQMAYFVLNEILTDKSNELLEERLVMLDLTLESIEPLVVEEESVSPPEQEAGFFLSFMLPMVLFLSCFSGGLSAATDLVAGEKERGTLEALVSTPVGGSPIMIGKMLSVMLVSFLSTLLTFAVVLLLVGLMPMVLPFESPLAYILTPEFFLLSMLIIVLVSAMIAAVQLSLSTLAKSFKEAQTYNTPLIVVILVPSYLLMLTPVTEIPLYYYVLPFVNVISFFKEILVGIVQPFHLLLVFGSSLLYVGLAVALFAHLFKKEKLILK